MATRLAKIKGAQDGVEVERMKVGDVEVTITTDYTDITEFISELKENVGRRGYKDTVYRKLFENIRARNRLMFESEGAAFGGEGWVPLSPRYATWKKNQRRFAKKKILELRGQLKASMVNKEYPTSKYGGIRDFGGGVNYNTAKFGTSVIHGAWHQTGKKSRGHGGPLPARPFMPDPDWVADELLRLTRIYVGSGFKRESLRDGARRGKAKASTAVNRAGTFAATSKFGR